MKVSLNTIKQFTSVDLTVDELVEKINRQLGGVEGVTNLGERYQGATIVRVVSCDDHPDADRLHVCKIDDAGVVESVDRDENGYVQVVCGAPNVRAGLLVVWLPPGSTVPSSATDSEPFVLDARELRGVVSNGMLASARELALGDDHDGILELDASEWKPAGVEVKPGASFAAAYGLDDTIIDIENKMFTHRPDCFGQLGVAREIAGIQHQSFTSPDWYKALPEFNSGEGLELSVKNDASEKVPRFMAAAVQGVEVKPSPVWMRVELTRLGSKPINNIVDVTNYVMLLTGQPLHAYDYDKLRGGVLGTRLASEGERITLLNGKTYELTADDVVIIDAEGPVGLGGVMGGGDSEVSADTKNIVLECATFDMYTIRKTSMRYGLFTDAVTRFNKGQSSHQNPYVFNLALMSISDTAGGKLASAVADQKTGTHDDQPVELTPGFINDRLGLNLSSDDVHRLLENVEFAVDGSDSLVVRAPFWRTDIHLAEDVVEEVGRLYGFDKLPRTLPARSTKPAKVNDRLVLKQRIRENLSRAGANEVLTYSFVHEKIMQRAQQNSEEAFRLSNALSPDLQYYRLSVLPSLLDKIHPNIKSGHDEFTLFELGKGHNKKHHKDDDDGLPAELEFVDAVYASKHSHNGAAFYMIRRYVDSLAKDLGIGPLTYKPITDALDFPVTAPFDLSRSAMVETKEGTFIGMVGELKQTVLKNFKLPAYCAAMTLDFEGLLTAAIRAMGGYTPLSRFPKVAQDLSLKISNDVTYAELEQLARSALEASELYGKGVMTLEPLTIYQPKDSNERTVTFHLEVASYERTLTDQEVTAVLDHIAEAASSARAERA